MVRIMFLWEKNLLRKKKFEFIAGLDEAGRGPLAGPLVVAAVILKPEQRKIYLSHKIADSKLLTPKQRAEAFKEIIKSAWIGIGIAEVGLIDNTNIFYATQFAADSALINLRKKPDYVLTDAGIQISSNYPYTCIIKGESKSFSIACASIVAKVIRDRIMEVYDFFFPHYAFKLHKGYGTQLHFNLLKKHGPSPLHRQSFAPIRDWFKR
ncbi:MAG: ribonuclease HII [Candidatus Omnitrophica bacterium]|nr:ribonuclease HII [Candidatus Omnitrophota bacterium]